MRKEVISIHVDTGSYQTFIERIVALGREKISSYVCAANVHMVIEAYQNKAFAKIVNDADLITPDGMPLAASLYILHGVKQPRVAGMDLVSDIIDAAGKHSLSVFLYGSTPEVLSAVVRRISTGPSHAKIAGVYSPPFRSLTIDEDASIIDRINASGANVILVALGCPKQEQWMATHRGVVNGVMVGIGGALPVYAGLQRRAPLFMQRLSLEWLFRLFREPKRLFKRYLITNIAFICLLVVRVFRKVFTG